MCQCEHLRSLEIQRQGWSSGSHFQYLDHCLEIIHLSKHCCEGRNRLVSCSDSPRKPQVSSRHQKVIFPSRMLQAVNQGSKKYFDVYEVGLE